MKSFILLLLYASSFSLHAQLYEHVHDTFNDNQYGWSLGDFSDHVVRIDRSKLIISKKEGKGRTIMLSRFLEEEKDFVLQATITFSSSAENKSAGLVWGHSDETSHDNYFAFSMDGYYIIESDQTGRKDIGRWIKTDLIKPVGEENILRLEQRDEKIFFYINSHLVKEVERLPWFDHRFGIITFVNDEISVDDFILESATKINLLTAATQGMVKENLGKNINSAYDDLGPVISTDGKTLYFSRKYSPDNVGGNTDREDLWFAASVEGQLWSRALNMGRTINTVKADNLAAVSADNNMLMFAVGNGEYAFVRRTANGWSTQERVNLGIQNEADYREAWLSADGQAILFTSKLKNNLYYQKEKNERDIFLCTKKKNGEWSKPVNLGAAINSKGDEASPFLAADGKTLYFATDGRPGFGDSDIFMSRRIDDSWTNWSEPVNLGPEINTPGFDAYYNVPASGDYAYMVSNINGYGKTDIIRIKLPRSLKPDPVVLVSGKVLNAKNNKPLAASIVFENLLTSTIVGEAIPDPATGHYSIVLPYGNNYGVRASVNGFMSVNENLELNKANEYTELQKDLYLIPLEVNQRLPLNNVFFEQGKPVLKRESFPELNRLVDMMKQHEKLVIELEGHTDNMGNAGALLVLSEERVGTVKQYLIKHGIEPSRINGKGYGGAKPLEKNDTEEHRRHNRRVEFRIIKI